MTKVSEREFTDLLDELIAAAEHEGEERLAVERAPSIAFDILMDAATSFRAASPAPNSEYIEALDILSDIDVVSDPEPPTTDLDAIAAELNLKMCRSVADFDRLRRDFAFGNHPDRVDEAVRAVAMVRMQVANRLIDEAKKRLVAAG